MSDEVFFYLITTGHKSGNEHEIEIWFVALDGCYYLCAEHGQRAHWVQNIQKTPQIKYRVGSRGDTLTSSTWIEGQGRVVNPADERDRHTALTRLFDEKYGWSDGLFVEICPSDLPLK